MPRAESPSPAALLDSWGRRNRSLQDKTCCSCGQVFRPLRATSRFCSRPCMWSKNGGHNRKSETWWLCKKGYIVGRIWEGGKRRHVKKHRLIMEQALGRRLLPSEDVHHVNGVKTDNRLENLIVLDRGAHSRITNAHRWAKAKAIIASAEGRS